jgi:hypothetical protein
MIEPDQYEIADQGDRQEQKNERVGVKKHQFLSQLFRYGRACPGHPRLSCLREGKTWMPGTRPGMTSYFPEPPNSLAGRKA